MKKFTFMGYRRENGRVGVRNHVLILPLDDISNAACVAVANNIKGTTVIPHGYGRLQFGEDLELFFRTIIGTGSNPNVAAVVVIGIEPGCQLIGQGVAGPHSLVRLPALAHQLGQEGQLPGERFAGLLNHVVADDVFQKKGGEQQGGPHHHQAAHKDQGAELLASLPAQIRPIHVD